MIILPMHLLLGHIFAEIGKYILPLLHHSSLPIMSKAFGGKSTPDVYASLLYAKNNVLTHFQDLGPSCHRPIYSRGVEVYFSNR